MSEQALQHLQGGITDLAVPVGQIKEQVNLIQHVMKEVMRDGEHYGKIPGCGDKPALLKPGAEKIMMTFRLSNDTEVEVVDMQGDHREYRVKSALYSPSGQRLGTGVGSCSTMESKYRYRTGAGELTDIQVPKSYWDNRDGKILKKLANDAGIEGETFGTKKDDSGRWVITTHGEKVEHDNPADFYNVALKMAKKRSLVDVTLTTTAASDIFTQDIEENPDLYKKPDTKQQAQKPAPKPRQSSPPRQQESSNDKAVKAQIDNIKQLQLHPSLSEDFVQYVTDRLNKGLTKKEALGLINEIEGKIGQVTPEVLK